MGNIPASQNSSNYGGPSSSQSGSFRGKFGCDVSRTRIDSVQENPPLVLKKEAQDNTVLDLDDDDDGEDSAHPLPIIIDRKRAPSGSKIPNPHRKRAATVSTRTTKAKNEAKPLTISTMFVWECTKTALGRKDPDIKVRSVNVKTVTSTAQVNENIDNPVAKEVFISGSFNSWQPIPMNLSESNFYCVLELPEGNHEYKFKVDGVWQHNNKEPVTSDGMGGFNNVLKVDQTDIEVLKALDVDTASQKLTVPVESLSDDSYGRRVPDLSAHTVTARGGPPILPPQLVHVILNKETPLNCEPTLLPTPHHVMVNHMYALSIKDLVMALSTTTRYRKKYVTTILYKPVD